MYLCNRKTTIIFINKMKKLLYSIMVALFAVVATSCSTQMGELSSDYVSCNPSPLVAKGGKVDATVSINFPAKFFPKKATLTVTPVLVAANGAEQKGEPVYYQGEKVKGNDQVIAYKTGGNASFKTSFDYDPAYAKSALYLDLKATKGSKTYNLPRVKIADGVVATETLASAENVTPAYGKDNFVKDTFRKYIATMIYEYQSTNLRASQTKTDEMKALNEAVAETKKNDRQELEGIDMVSTASPEGSYQLNERLAAGREKSSSNYLNSMLKKAKVQGTITPEQIAEDWEGFQQLVSESDIRDKQLILDVLGRFSDPAQRESEIRNLSAAYTELADKILPQLRYSKVTATVKNIGKTNEEIAAVWASKPESLTVEEALYYATLLDNDDARIPVYEKIAQIYPQDPRALNNLAGIYYKKGNYDKAADLWKQVKSIDPTSPQASLNQGLLALRNGDVRNAETLISNGALAQEYGEAMATVNTLKGNYDEAISQFGNVNTNNKAVAQICAGKLMDATNTLNAVANPDGMTSYLKAIIAARQSNGDAVVSNLKQAVQLDPSLAQKAENDIEFAKYASAITGI